MSEAKYFLTSEVVIHNRPHDFWVTYNGKVYDLTPLAHEFKGKKVMQPLLAFAGKDISHMFDPITKDISHFIHPITNVRVPYTPHGKVPHVGPQVPTTKWRPLAGLPWWLDSKYCIGKLSEKSRPLRVINVLTGHSETIMVCSEDKLSRILERYLRHNRHAGSYTWKQHSRVLNMNKTLEQNKVLDEREKFRELGLSEDTHVPALMLYYNDDLTEDSTTN